MAKKTRNKAKDMIGGYWQANRQAERENEEAKRRQGEDKKKGWSSSEKMMLGIIIVGAIGLVVRYVILKI